MYKRPSFRPHGCYHEPRALPPLARGVVAELARRSDPPPPAPKAWRPPLDVQAYFDLLRKRGEDTSGYEKLAAEFKWPEPPRRAESLPPLDLAPLEELFYKAKDIPPQHIYLEVLRKSGYPEERVAKMVAYFKMLEETKDERQEKLDLIFARWPSASKTEKKVIKAVKKKITS